MRCASCSKSWFVTPDSGIEEARPWPDRPQPEGAASPTGSSSSTKEQGGVAPPSGTPEAADGKASAEGTSLPPPRALGKQDNVDAMFASGSEAPGADGSEKHDWRTPLPGSDTSSTTSNPPEAQATEEAAAKKPPAPKRPRGPKRPPKPTMAQQTSAALRSPVGIGLIGLFLLLAIYVQREMVVRIAPAANKVFAALGAPVNLVKLDFGEVQTTMLQETGGRFLLIEGVVSNTSRERAPVPPIETALLDAKGQELYVWTTEPPRATLRPGETLVFRTRLAAPPEAGKDVKVRFATATTTAQARQ